MKTVRALAFFGLLLALPRPASALPGPAELPDANPCGPIRFVAASVYPTGSGINALVAGDFNGDGLTDLAISGYDDPGLVVLLGKPDGTFQPPIPTTADTAIRMAAGHFDADSHLDLVIAQSGLSLLSGNGDGTFQAPVEIDGGYATSPVAADLDGDGKTDVVALTFGGVEVLLGNGNGTFATAVSYPAGFNPTSIAVGDVNHDGKPDAVVSAYGSVAVLLNNGNGTFQAPISIALDGALEAIAIADMDGDGNADIVGASGAVLVFKGDGTGHFAAGTPYPLPPGLSALDLSVFDYDGDGHPDVAAATPAPGYVVLLHNAGDGTLVVDRAYLGGNVPLVAASFGVNGAMDLALGSNGPGLSVLYGWVGSLFSGSPASGFAAAGAYGMTLGDFNEDGIPDAAAGMYGDSSSGPDLFILPGTGDGRFSPGYTASYGERLLSVAAADFNEDGHLDLLLTGELTGVFVLPGHGDGTFGNPIGTPATFFGFYAAPVVTRLGPASHFDVIVAGGGVDGRQITALLGNGNGTFTQGPTQNTPAYPQAMAAGDFNGDGFSDLAIASNDGMLTIWLGTGDGNFNLLHAYTSGTATSLVAADIDGDGKVDVTASAAGTIVVFYGNGDGSFDPQIYGLGWTASMAAAADLDGDGILDLVAVNRDPNNVAVLRGLGSRHFASPIPFPAGAAPNLIAIADLDGDGSLDVAADGADGIATLLGVSLAASVSSGSAIVEEIARLQAQTTGVGALSYQWRKGGVPLTDGGTISGSQTATLTIDPVSFADAGSYDVIVTDACGSTGSNAASLSVEFADVPVSSPFHDDILTIATAGITSGCGGGDYCPTSPVRRDQMAVFLLKSEHGSSYLPPDCTGVFADVPCPGPFTNWVERLAAEGVTSSCGGGNYCPGNSVTRAQMAVFLLKTKNGSSYTPPPATGIFGDVPVGSFAADFIEALYNAGVTGGCQASPLLYCPDNSVLRQQMATFLVRTFAP